MLRAGAGGGRRISQEEGEGQMEPLPELLETPILAPHEYVETQGV
jgi:hypothetical protein